MARLITALFDNRADAEAAKERLRASSIDVDNLHIVDQSTQGYQSGSYTTRENRGFWASLKDAFLPDEDRHTYEEGVHRGGYLLTGEVADDHVDEAVRVLDEAGTVDIDDRANSWRQSGWQGPAVGAAAGMGASAYSDPSRVDANSDYGTDRSALNVGTSTGMDRDRNAEVIPVVEEQLVVGKREVERGGVRVRSYVVERPVTEQVQLREEHVHVERRAVDQPLSSVDGDAFRERTIALTETSEEAVVGKTARVVEEVVVSKDVGTRTETVTDTVRRTEVDVDNDMSRDTYADNSLRTGGTMGATGGVHPGTGKASGLVDEAIGNLKQGVAGITGNERLDREGEMQERRGEAKQGDYDRR